MTKRAIPFLGQLVQQRSLNGNTVWPDDPALAVEEQEVRIILSWLLNSASESGGLGS